MSTDDRTVPAGATAVEMGRLLPRDLVDRGTCPFDPAPGFAARRGRGPVQTTTLLNDVEAWVVTGFAEARTVLSDPRFSADRVRHPDASRPQEPAPSGGCPVPHGREDGMFIFMDPPEHTRLRGLLTGQFTVRRMRALTERVREIAVEHIEAMTAAGTTADLVSAYALPLPSLMICEVLGVDYAGDREQFQRNTSISLNITASDEDRARAQGELYAFIQQLVTEKREHPTDDVLSGVIHDADPPLTNTQVVDMAMVLLGAGHETTANMLGLGTFALLQNPVQLAALREDPGLISGAVEELLRYLSIIQLGVMRIALEPVTVDGVEIPAGATVVIAVPEVNRDAGHVPADDSGPDDLDVRRPRRPHLAFGHGIHQCLGQQLARVEMEVGFTEILARLPRLRLAVPAEQVSLRNDMAIFGVHSLPVTWA